MRAFSYIQECVSSVGQIQYPQQSQSLGVREQAARPEPWLTLRREVQIPTVLLENIDRQPDQSPGVAKRLGLNEVEVIGRGVVLNIFAVGRAHEASHR